MRGWMLALLLTTLVPGLRAEDEAPATEPPAPASVAAREPASAPSSTPATPPSTPSAEAAALAEITPALTMGEAIAAAPDGPEGDELVPTPDPIDPIFEAHLVHDEVMAGAAELAMEESEVISAGASFLAAVAELAGSVDHTRIHSTVPANEREAPSIAAEPDGPAAPTANLRGYREDLQRAFLKYGSDGVIPGASVNWLAETYDRRVVEVAHDLRQMARNAGVIIPDFERTDPPPPEPTVPAVIPSEVVAGGRSPEIHGSYLHALEHVLEKYDLVRLVPERSLSFLGKVHERTPEQVLADLKSIAKPESEAVLPDYAY